MTIYDQSIEVPAELLERVENPRLSEVHAVNDAGIFGSFIYVQVPFGEIGRCRSALRNKARQELWVTSGDSAQKPELRARLFHPCER